MGVANALPGCLRPDSWTVSTPISPAAYAILLPFGVDMSAPIAGPMTRLMGSRYFVAPQEEHL